ncbi:phage tail protein [Desulfovibrio piger]|uniref:phage tail protein n=1 Tax=Desulfovibrio piger TaxID=901 RepID=UPI0026650C64|nr:phage tail protein [Desulfovibrio piger]
MKAHLSKIIFLVWSLLWAVPAHSLDATSFNPTAVEVTAKATSSIPVGTIIAWPVAQNPADWQNSDGSYNWLECNGQSISKTVYPELFALMGGHTPDLRGLFLRGHGGNSAGLGEQQGHAMRDISASGNISVGFGGYLSGSGIFKPVGSHKVTVIRGTWDNNWSSTNYGLDLSAGGVPVANEVRPDNQAVRYLIRAIP